MRIILLVVFCCLILFSCITESDTDIEDFSFKITVKDLMGNPVDNLNIILINKFNYPSWVDYETKSRAPTLITFILVEDSFVDLNILDIDGNHIRNILNEDLQPGYYAAAWYCNDDDDYDVASGLYYCSMDASENDTLYYHGDVMMYFLSLDSNHRHGYTNSEGVYESINKNPFLNLYDLDSLRIVDETGVFLGSEAFSDTTVICLFDDILNEYYQFEYVVVENGKNEFDIIWEPDSLRKIVEKTNELKIDHGRGPTPPVYTELEGNFPNPFN